MGTSFRHGLNGVVLDHGTALYLASDVARLQASHAALVESVEWLLNLLHGVSRYAGDGFHHGISQGEWAAADQFARAALALAQKEQS
jgi:hypothetical protein